MSFQTDVAPGIPIVPREMFPNVPDRATLLLAEITPTALDAGVLPSSNSASGETVPTEPTLATPLSEAGIVANKEPRAPVAGTGVKPKEKEIPTEPRAPVAGTGVKPKEKEIPTEPIALVLETPTTDNPAETMRVPTKLLARTPDNSILKLLLGSALMGCDPIGYALIILSYITRFEATPCYRHLLALSKSERLH
jgi:hypothetical protein